MMSSVIGGAMLPHAPIFRFATPHQLYLGLGHVNGMAINGFEPKLNSYREIAEVAFRRLLIEQLKDAHHPRL